MPTYEYKCKDHGHIFEVEQKMSDPPLTSCEICGAEVERLIGMPTIFCKDSATSSYKKDFRSDHPQVGGRVRGGLWRHPKR